MGPLHGLKVVEIGVAMAAPYCCQVLGDYGADVVKIERIGVGDDSRWWPPIYDGGMSHYYAAANRNKRSIAVDLKAPDGVAFVESLVAGADVLVENYRVGVLDRIGLGYAAMSELNPRLVYCSISGFGRSGPKAEDRANDLFMQAYSGGMSVTGELGGGPMKMGISVADIGAGLFAAFGVLAAIEARHLTGTGQHVSTSLLEGQLAMLSYHLTRFDATGVAPGPQGSGSDLGTPYHAFPTADDWVVIAAFNDRMWRGLCDGIDRPEWADDPRFAAIDDRTRNRDEFDALLTEVLRTAPASHWESVLQAHGVPCTRVNRIDQIVSEPQVCEGDMVRAVDVPAIGTIRVAAPPVHFGGQAGSIRRPPPALGEHTAELLREQGYADETIAEMHARGAVGLATPPLP